MIKLNYDVHLGTPNSPTEILVAPIFEAAYVTSIPSRRGFVLNVPPYEAENWQWLYSAVPLQSFEEQVQFLATCALESPLIVREAFHPQKTLDKAIYEAYAKRIFAALRCGWTNPEMTTKTLGAFASAEWAEVAYLLKGCVYAPDKPILTCRIEPLYAVVQSLLPPFEVKPNKKWDVKTWKPKDAFNYRVVWHLLVTLSNGEKYKMYYPIASLNQWQQMMKSYFEKHPTELFSPLHYSCSVTNHAEAYRYEEIIRRLNFFESLTVGMSSSEILIKLSAFFNFPERATHLKTLLTENEVELVFSGNVVWT
jgi:hypothetical protein